MAQHKPTDEHQATPDAMSSGDNIAILAHAGTGKTATLRMFAEARPDKQTLRFVFGEDEKETR